MIKNSNIKNQISFIVKNKIKMILLVNNLKFLN